MYIYSKRKKNHYECAFMLNSWKQLAFWNAIWGKKNTHTLDVEFKIWIEICCSNRRRAQHVTTIISRLNIRSCRYQNNRKALFCVCVCQCACLRIKCFQWHDDILQNRSLAAVDFVFAHSSSFLLWIFIENVWFAFANDIRNRKFIIFISIYCVSSSEMSSKFNPTN